MINILFGGNYKVYDGILLTIMSMIKHCKDPINIIILTADLTKHNPEYKPIQEKDIETLNTIVKRVNPESKVSSIMLGDEFNNWAMNSENKLNQYTPFAFLRLFADKINLPEKVIYLDSDIMLNGNIKELFDIDMTNYELGVVKDRYGRWFINPRYFNSGVLLMNMKNIKESNLLERVRNICFSKKWVSLINPHLINVAKENYIFQGSLTNKPIQGKTQSFNISANVLYGYHFTL